MQNRVEIKICGLTDPVQAERCAELGADAVGLIFYAKSPRFVEDALAREIARAVNGRSAVVGVFVDEPYESIMRRVERCGITAVQLHGAESDELVDRLRQEGLTVLKALFQKRPPDFGAASSFNPSAFLLECGRGRLPGGNAEAWDWGAAAGIAAHHPVVLAGGLSPENVVAAVDAGRPDAVDVSSGVEVSPGKKDMQKVKEFIAAVNRAGSAYNRLHRRVFQC